MSFWLRLRSVHPLTSFFCAGMIALVLTAAPLASTAAQSAKPRTHDNATDSLEGRKDSLRTPQTQIVDTLADPALTVARDSADTSRRIVNVARDSGIDTVVNFYSTDSAVYSIRRRKVELHGNARVDYGSIRLVAETIAVQLDSATLTASAGRDSLGRLTGVPNFTDGGEEFYGERITFNFTTQKGTIALGETVIDNGFYFGDKIKRVDNNTLFVENGCFTTCDKPHPHFFFKSPEMKVITNDRVFADPLIVYVEDLPVFALPFGVFFENKRGRRSGILIPSFFFSGSAGADGRGIIFENVGYFWAIDDYFDTKLWGTFTTKGGFQLWDETRWVIRDKLSSTLRLSLGNVRFSPDDEHTTNWGVSFRHNQELTPQSNINANVEIASPDFNRQTNTNIGDRVVQSITSNAAYSRNFDNGTVFSVNYSRNQNLITERITETLPRISYSIPQIKPFRGFVDRSSWVSDIAFSMRLEGNRTLNSFHIDEVRDTDNAVIEQERDSVDISQKISYAPSISISPKLGYFSLTPSIRTSGNFLFRRLTRDFNPADSTISNSFEDGLFWQYDFSLGMTLGTRLYGTAYPGIFGVNALRHVFSPSVTYTYTPDFSDNSFGFYGEYFDAERGETVRYNRFQADGVGVAAGLVSSISVRLNNVFEAKVAQPDTLPDKAIRLFNFDAGGSYNFAADSLNFSTISTALRTSAGAVNINARGTFDLYEQVETFDEDGDSEGFRKVDRLLLDAGGGLARLVSATLTLSTALSSEGVSNPLQIRDNSSSADSIDFGARFRSRDAGDIEQSDLFGDRSPGYSDFSLPWRVNLSASFNYAEPNPRSISRSFNLSASLNLSLTNTWRLNSSLSYDVIDNEVNAPSVEINKDLHCWDLAFRWVPSGFSRGFHLSLAIKAPQLQDLKLEKREGPLY